MDTQQTLSARPPPPKPGHHESPLVGEAATAPRRPRSGGARVFRPSTRSAAETPFRSVARVVTFSPGEGGDGGTATDEAPTGDVDPPERSWSVADPPTEEDDSTWAMMRSVVDVDKDGDYDEEEDGDDAQDSTEVPSQTNPKVCPTETPRTVILTASDSMLEQDRPSASAMDVFKSNVAELARDDHAAYLRKIQKLERQLFAARSTIERQRRTQQGPSSASTAPATPEPSGPPTLESLLERNQTLVKEVRFADQTCVELASERDSLSKRLRAAEERLGEAQAANARLVDQVRESTQVAAQAQLRNDKDMELIVELQNDKLRDQETIHRLEQQLQQARTQLESLGDQSSMNSALQRRYAETHGSKDHVSLVESLQHELQLMSNEKTQLENALDQLTRQYDKLQQRTCDGVNEGLRAPQIPPESSTAPILAFLASPDAKVGDNSMASPDTACFFTPIGNTRSLPDDCQSREPTESCSRFSTPKQERLDGAHQGTEEDETLEAYEALVTELKQELNDLSVQFLSVSEERDHLFKQKEELDASRLEMQKQCMSLRAQVDGMEKEMFRRNSQLDDTRKELGHARKHIQDMVRSVGVSMKAEHYQQRLAFVTRDLEDTKARLKVAESDAKDAAAKIASSQHKVDKLKDYVRKLTLKYEEHNAYCEKQSILIAKLKVLNSKFRREAMEVAHSYEKRENDYNQEKEIWTAERMHLTNQLDEISRALLDMPPKSDLKLPSLA